MSDHSEVPTKRQTDEPAECWLVADIGGTHARFGLSLAPGLVVTDVRVMRCVNHAHLHEAAHAYLDGLAGAGRAQRPRRACFAIAGPVTAEPVHMTNHPWVISRAQVSVALGLTELTLLNDFEAVALALPALGPDDTAAIGPGAPANVRLPMAVIGPGTGLGVALCVPADGRWIAVPTEGGHSTAVAADDFEGEVLRRVRSDFGHVSAERLLSGIGLPVLYRAVAQARGAQVLDLNPEQITRGALEDSDAACAATLETFFSMLGTFAGNVALTSGARGGVFIAGGIAQRLAAPLTQSRFRERFEAKGRYHDYMAAIPTRLITAPHGALIGAARAIAHGQHEG
jgi:glucokinase